MRKNKRKKEQLSFAMLVLTSEEEELCQAVGYLRAACDKLHNLYIMAKQCGDVDAETYFFMRFVELDRVLWSLVNY